MRIAAIVAMTENRVIGKNNQLPWHLPADLQHFKQITMGKPIIMGRKTFQSIGRALPGRLNIVLTKDDLFYAKDSIVVDSFAKAVAAAYNSDTVFIIGGATLFDQFLIEVDYLYLTVIHAEIPGDTFFPELNPDDWEEVSCERHAADEKNRYPFSFIEKKRVKNVSP